MRKRIFALLAVLFCLSGLVAAAEKVQPDLTGTWRFNGGGELLGYGFALQADGTGRFLESEDWAVFPQRHLHETGEAPFAWQLAQGEEAGLRLQLTFADGHTAVYPVQLENDELSVTEDDPEFLGGGGYERYDEDALRAWLDTAEQTPLTNALLEYLDDKIETRLADLGLRSPEIRVYPAGNGYVLRLNAVVNDIVWTVETEMDAEGTRVVWNPLNPSSAAPEAEGGHAVWGPDVPLQGVLQSAVDSARQAVTEAERAKKPAEMPVLTGQKTQWKNGKAYPVYQGPGKSYGRGANGRAKVATAEPFYVYGTWRGYLLISYQITPGHHRFGWILASDIPAGRQEGFEPLPFAADSAETDYRLGVTLLPFSMTDDPDYTRADVALLPAGSSVHCLALYGDWMLVEGFANGRLSMGFVPADIVDREHGYAKDAEYRIDAPGTYSQADIRQAMDTVSRAIEDSWRGTHLLRIRYTEEESADPDAWWQREDKEGMKLLADLNDIGLYDYEISGEVASDYGFILYREPGGAWEIGNWGYE